MKKSRIWQAIAPGTQTKPQDTLQIRKTPWHGVTKQPPAVLCRQTPLLNGMKKSRFWQEFHCWGTELHCSRHRNLCAEHQRHFELGCWQAIPLDTLQIRKTPWHGVTKQPPAVPLPGPNVTPEPNEKSRVWQAIFPGTQIKQATRHPSNQENTLARRTKQPKQPSNQENTLASRRNSLLPSLCPGQTSLLNRMKKSRFWQAIHCSKAQKASQKTPFESGNTLARLLPSLCPGQTSLLNQMKKSRCWQAIPLFQAQKPSHRTPFKSGKHPGTA